MPSNTLETAWQRQKDWSQTADRLKRSLGFWQKVVLLLAIVAAVAGTISAGFDEAATAGRVLAGLAAVAAAMSPVIAGMRLDQTHSQQWIRARTASEAYKAEIFRYRTQTGDYAGVDRSEVLGQAIEAIDESVADIMRKAKSGYAPPVNDTTDLLIDEYLVQRVTQQIQNYYLPKEALNDRIAQNYRTAHLVFMLIGAVLGGIATVSDAPLGPWIAVVTTISASVLAHGAAGRHDYLAISFGATARRLENLANAWSDARHRRGPTPEECAALVSSCEDVISNENKSWHAKFLKPVAAGARGNGAGDPNDAGDHEG